MCVLLVAYRSHPHYDLVVAANRDEFYDRPTAAAEFWSDFPQVLAGRDLGAGGTWLGINTAGYFAAVTNLRGMAAPSTQYSRGHLVRDFLTEPHSCEVYLDGITPSGPRYAGCNLLVEDTHSLHWWTNTDRRALGAGVYGMSNSVLDLEWPKVTRLKSAFEPLTAVRGEALESALFDTLRDRPIGATSLLDYSRLEEMIFVHSPSYGTRCSTVVLRRRDGPIVFVERSFDRHGHQQGEVRLALPR
jgi:uncharacterized protein with NRDE domain